MRTKAITEQAAQAALAGQHVLVLTRGTDVAGLFDALARDPQVLRALPGQSRLDYDTGGEVLVRSARAALAGHAPDLVLVDDGTWNPELAAAVGGLTAKVVWL
jgi:hypothetical protein